MDNNFNNEQQYQQPVYQQPVYQQPVYQQPTEDTSVMTIGQWMLTTFLLMLPCVGLIMAFVWGFGSGNVNRKNYCRAWLIWQAIGIVAGILFSSIISAAVIGIMESMMYM